MDGGPRALSIDVTGGLIALVVALAAASGLGLVLRRRAGPDGAIVKRAAGLPRKADVIAALGSVTA
jgi:hypothetical protein